MCLNNKTKRGLPEPLFLDIETEKISSGKSFREMEIFIIAAGEDTNSIRSYRIEQLRDLGQIEVIGHNITSFDSRVLREHGVTNITVADDTLALARELCRPQGH